MTTQPFEDAQDIVQRAFLFAKAAHLGQKRKYVIPAEDYINHPVRVALHLRDTWKFYDRQDFLIIALLHDVLEDTHCTIEQMLNAFGAKITSVVIQLTEFKYAGLSRIQRKDLYRHQIAAASDTAKLVKLADIWDNLSDFANLVAHDEKFAMIYLDEKERLVQGIQPNASAFLPTQDILTLIKKNRELYF